MCGTERCGAGHWGCPALLRVPPKEVGLWSPALLPRAPPDPGWLPLAGSLCSLSGPSRLPLEAHSKIQMAMSPAAGDFMMLASLRTHWAAPTLPLSPQSSFPAWPKLLCTMHTHARSHRSMGMKVPGCAGNGLRGQGSRCLTWACTLPHVPQDGGVGLLWLHGVYLGLNSRCLPPLTRPRTHSRGWVYPPGGRWSSG